MTRRVLHCIVVNISLRRAFSPLSVYIPSTRTFSRWIPSGPMEKGETNASINLRSRKHVWRRSLQIHQGLRHRRGHVLPLRRVFLRLAVFPLLCERPEHPAADIRRGHCRHRPGVHHPHGRLRPFPGTERLRDKLPRRLAHEVRRRQPLGRGLHRPPRRLRHRRGQRPADSLRHDTLLRGDARLPDGRPGPRENHHQRLADTEHAEGDSVLRARLHATSTAFR